VGEPVLQWKCYSARLNTKKSTVGFSSSASARALTLIAAENTGRVCCGIELDPLYVDVIIRRYEAETGIAAILADSGETFEKVVARRRNDESDD
jgi:DNA modification methylase